MIKWIVPLAMSSAVVGSHAQTLTFLGEGGLVTSLELDELVLNAVDSYSSSSIQFRVFDLFPAGVGFTGSEFDSSSVDFAVNGTVTPLTSFGFTTTDLNNELGDDGIFWIDFESSISIAPGDALTLSGTASVVGAIGASLALPIAGTYEAYFVSSQDGAPLTDVLSANVVIPEPSTYALLLSAGAVGAVVATRRLRKKNAA